MKIAKNEIIKSTTKDRLADVFIDAISANPEYLNKLTDIWAENQRLDKQIQFLEMQNEKQILVITKRYEMFRDILTAVFSERQVALSAHYKTLDNALASNDKELIIASLKGISSIVEQNPLSSLAEFTKILDNENDVLELNF